MYRPSHRVTVGGVSMPKHLAEGMFKEAVDAANKQDNSADLASKVQKLLDSDGTLKMLFTNIERPPYKDDAEFLIGLMNTMGQQTGDLEVRAYFEWLKANVHESRPNFLQSTLAEYQSTLNAKATAEQKPSSPRP